jgi:hypothetical protein
MSNIGVGPLAGSSKDEMSAAAGTSSVRSGDPAQ